MSLLELPLDIIEMIIVSSNRVLTTYNRILDVSMTMSNINMKKRKRSSKNDNINIIENKINNDYNTIENVRMFLMNPVIINNIYKKSRWYKYFMSSYEFTNHTKQLSNIQNIFKQMKPMLEIKEENKIHHNGHHTTQITIEYLDEHINLDNLDTMITKLVQYWNIEVSELSNTVILFAMLSSSNIFKLHTTFDLIKHIDNIDYHVNNNKHIHIPKYLEAKYKFIPLFQTYLGMGLSFNIAWDINLNCLLGFLYGGSDAYDYEYYNGKLAYYLNMNNIERRNFIRQKNKITNGNKLLDIIIRHIDNYNLDYSVSRYEKMCINYD